MGCCSLTLYCGLILVPRLVSVAVLWFALPAVGCALLLPAVGLALLPAVGFALLLAAVGFAVLGSFHRLSAALRAHRRFDVLLTVLVPVLLYFVLLFTNDSLAVVLSRILTTCSLAVVPSLTLSRDTLWQVTSSWMPRLHLQHHYSALRPSRSLARGKCSGSLVVWFTTTCSADCEGCSERFVAAAVRRWFPTPLQHHCVILWAVSTLITKAYIAASCHGVIRRFVRRRRRVLDPHVSLV